MKARVIAAGVFFIIAIHPVVFSQPATQSRVTLRECVEAAITNNLQVRQSDLQMQTAAVNLNQSKANVIPDLFGNLGHGFNQGRSIDPFTNSYINQQITYANYSLSSTVVLFNGFQIKNLIRQNSLSYEANKMDLQQTKDNVTLNVILTYLQILNAGNSYCNQLTRQMLVVNRLSV